MTTKINVYVDASFSLACINCEREIIGWDWKYCPMCGIELKMREEEIDMLKNEED